MSVQGPESLHVDSARRETSRRPGVAGAAAGVWSLLVGVALVSCLVLLAWAVSPNSAGDSAAAWRAAAYTWLGSHLVPLEFGGRELSLQPLGALLLGLLLTRRAGRWAGRLLPATSPGEVGVIVAACALVYGAGGAGLAWLSAVGSTGADPLQAFLWTAAVAGIGVTWGIAREADLIARLRARMSDAAWRTLVAALASVVGLLTAGGALVTISLVRSFSQVGATLADLDAGPVGELVLTLLGALSLPTLDIWALSLIVGPGFDLGTLNGLDILGGQVNALPALPVLAAIPVGVPAWAPLLMLVPAVLGVLAARIRWGRDLPTLSGTVVSGAGLAAAVAVMVAGLALLASGSLGGGRLSQVGPAPVPVAAAAAGLVLLGFIAEAGFQSARLSWDLYRAQRRAEGRGVRRERGGSPRPAADAAATPSGRAAAGGTPEDTADAADAPVAAASTTARRSPGAQPGLREAGPRPAPTARVSITIPVTAPRPQAAPAAAPAAVSSDPDAGETPAQVETQADGVVGPGDAQEPDVPGDGDMTVDLTVDSADMASLRAAFHAGEAGDPTSDDRDLDQLRDQQ